MSPRPHFLVLTYPLQGHIAPALRLARRLLAAAPDALVTFSTTAAAHRRMFPGKSEGPDGAAEANGGGGGGGRLEFLPFSDGTESGYVRSSDLAAFNEYMASFHTVGPRSVGEIVDALAARGRPVSRVVYTLLLPWAADVGRTRGVPSALYWIQPVSVFAIYYHYFHGHAGVVIDHRHDPSFVVQLPGLAPLAVGDLPSFLTDSTDPSDLFHGVYTTLRDLFDTIDRETPKATVLVNTCQELEVDALTAVGAHDVLPIGPVLPSGDEAGLFKQDDARYMEWLDTKPANSVVYVSFGSLATMERDQLHELLLGLEESGRPYLCVIRKDNKAGQERHGGGVVRPDAGPVPRGGGLLRDALRMELGAGECGLRRADGGCASDVGPTDERAARRARVACRRARGGGWRHATCRGGEAACRGGDGHPCTDTDTSTRHRHGNLPFS